MKDIRAQTQDSSMIAKCRIRFFRMCQWIDFNWHLSGQVLMTNLHGATLEMIFKCFAA